jgi:hypothetical protein
VITEGKEEIKKSKDREEISYDGEGNVHVALGRGVKDEKERGYKGEKHSIPKYASE